MENLKEKGVTDFTDAKKVIEAIYLCDDHPLVRESYLKQVSYNYPDAQAYKDILKNVTSGHSKQNLIYVTYDDLDYAYKTHEGDNYDPSDGYDYGSA